MGPVITVDSVRDVLTGVIDSIKELEMVASPPTVQEYVLARRAAEDARMRLGVGAAYEAGHNPWESKVENK